MADYGVLGVGEIGEAIVTGLGEGLVSPRNAERAARLAARFERVSVAESNQAVLDGADVVVIAVRPQDARAVLEPLRFRAGQAIVSLVAGLSIKALGGLVAPADDIARAIPLPPVANRSGVTPIHPGGAAASKLFERLGGALTVPDIEAFDAMAAATATVAAHLAYVAAVSRWVSEHGVPPEDAARYVASVFSGVGAALEHGDPAELARSHATPGGLNERFRRSLEQAGTYELVRESLDEIFEGL